MQFLEMQEHVAQLIGDESYVQFKLPQIKRYLNMGLRYVAGQIECSYALTTATQLDNIFNAPKRPGGVVLDTKFLRIHEVRVGSNGTLIPPMAWNDAQQAISGTSFDTTPESGDPTHYFILPHTYSSFGSSARRMEFYPAQPRLKTLTVNIAYITYPAELVGDTDIPMIPEMLHETVCLYALSRCKLQENDYEGAKFIMESDIQPRLLDAQFEIGPSTSSQYGIITDVNAQIY